MSDAPDNTAPPAPEPAPAAPEPAPAAPPAPVAPVAPAAAAPYAPPPPPVAAPAYPSAPPVAAAKPAGGGKAIASLVLGILGLLGWCLPIIGVPMSITGLVLGILDLKGSKRGIAIAGVVLCVLTLLLACGNAALGAYLGLSGQMNTPQFMQP